MKLNLHILALGYLEDGPSYFMEIIKSKDKDKEEQNNEPPVSNSEKEKKKKKILQKKNRDAWVAACLLANCFSALSIPLVPGLTAPPVSGLFALSLPSLSTLPLLGSFGFSAPL